MRVNFSTYTASVRCSWARLYPASPRRRRSSGSTAIATFQTAAGAGEPKHGGCEALASKVTAWPTWATLADTDNAGVGGLAAAVGDQKIAYTVFAPTDDAFNKLAPSTMNSLKTDASKLRSVLSFHVVSDRLGPKQIDANNTNGYSADMKMTVTKPGQDPQTSDMTTTGYYTGTPMPSVTCHTPVDTGSASHYGGGASGAQMSGSMLSSYATAMSALRDAKGNPRFTVSASGPSLPVTARHKLSSRPHWVTSI